MKLHPALHSTALASIICILSTFTLTHAKKSERDNSYDKNGNNDPSPSSVGGGGGGGGHDLVTPTYAQTMEDAIRELVEDFNHMTTSLTAGFAHHPLFSHHTLGKYDAKSSSSSSSSRKPFSTWRNFGSLARWSPRYEVIDDAKSFRVKMDVPGFHFHEMNVELESGGRVLSISGTKESNVHDASSAGWNNGKEKKNAMVEKANEEEEEEEEDNIGAGDNKFSFTSHTSTSFHQKFTLDPSIDTSLLTANLVNGVLEVRAPRKHGAWNKKHIPITQFDEDVWKELLATDDEADKLSEDVPSVSQF